MEPKLTILFALIAAIIGFSYFHDQSLARVKQKLTRHDWREFMRRRPNQ